MTKNILLLGRTGFILEDVQHQLQTPNIQLFASTGIENVRSAFAKAKTDRVVMGAGIDLETRLQIVRKIFQSSDTTTVYMKDRATGPQGMLPFVRSVLSGVRDYRIKNQ